MLLLYLFLLFTVGPLIEISLLVYLGTLTGTAMVPIGLILLTGIVGASLARWQGVQALSRVQRRMARGQMPAEELFDGMLILIAGIVLVTPGLITDLLGFGLLIPPIRRLLKQVLRQWAAKHLEVRTMHVHSGGNPFSQPPSDGDEIIDVQVVETRVVE